MNIETEIQQWKLKKTIKKLNDARGNGTSMISLIIPPGDQISRVNKMLTDEAGTASNIKSRVNRLSVLGAITSTQQKLKMYTKIPPNGLVLYCGEVMNEQNKSKKVIIDFEPFKPLKNSLYLCDNRFHTEELNSLLESNDTFGFIVLDGSGALFGTLCGNNKLIKQTISVELPKKHGRGGQSALRFARLRLEKRHNYLKKVAELATANFISNDIPNIKGIVLAGLAMFKNDLQKSDLFDPRLQKIVVTLVDVAYGGENGFNQAIDLASDSLTNVKYIAEKKLLSKFYEEINKDSGKYCYGIKDTIEALDQGAVETLIMWEDLDIIALKTDNNKTIYLNSNSDRGNENIEKNNYEIIDEYSLTEYLAENYRDYGCKLEFISDRTEEGNQFCKGFGGIGGLLRYKVEFYNNYDDDDYDENNDSDDSFM